MEEDLQANKLRYYPKQDIEVDFQNSYFYTINII